MIDELGGVERRRDGTTVAFAAGGAVFAVLADALLEVALDATVLKAALKTPDTAVVRPGPRVDRVLAQGRRSLRARPRGGLGPLRPPARNAAAERALTAALDRAASQTPLADVEWNRTCSIERQMTPGWNGPCSVGSLRARIGTPGVMGRKIQ